MGSIRGYLLSIVSVCLLYAVCDALVHARVLRRVVRLIGGLAVLLVVLTPLLGLRFDGVFDYFSDLEQAAQDNIAQSQAASKEAMRARVSAAAEAYIEQQALAQGITVQARVSLSDGEYPLPERVTLIGTLSPSQITALTQLITNQLGIAPECQEWEIYGSSE